MKPKKVEFLRCREEKPNLFLVYHASSGSSYLLNSRIFNVFMLCDGKKDIDKICDDSKLDKKTVLEILEDLKSNELICFS